MRHLIFLLLVALSGCGKFDRIRSGETSVNISVAGPSGPAAVTLNGGVMVYAMRVGMPGSKGAIYLGNESSSVNWVIPNGTYDFLAFGYSSASMGGSMYCGTALNRTLSGGAATIPLTLDDNNICGTPPFSPTNYGAAGGSAPLAFKLAACDPADGDISLVAPPSTGCGTSGGRPSAGNIETMKISFPEFTRWNPGEEPANKGPGIQSGCISGPFNGGGTILGSRLIPMGPFAVQIEAFSISACTGFMGAYTFLNGMAAAHDNSSIRFINSNNVRVFPSLQMGLSAYQAGASSYLFLRQL